MTNMIPNFARDDVNDVKLSLQQADNLLRYQLLLPHPRYLSELAFFISGIVGAQSLSKKVYRSLVKNTIILPTPTGRSEQEGSGMTVNTAGINKNFVNQLAVISVHAQRKVVGLLFFWEEECVRWNLLDAEEQEILVALEANGQSRDLVLALESVAMKKKLLPSQRGEGTANVGAGRGHELPGYS